MDDRRTHGPRAPNGARSGVATLTALAALYLAQGLPFGFQAHGLRAYLRESGMDLGKVGLAGALAAPWMLKALWAPLVDRYGSERLGRRRSWILPLQILLALTCAAVALTPPGRGFGTELAPLLGLILLLNLLAATQDIAVDGLAIDVLRPDQLGRGNAAQVVGFKVGMLIGGGLLVWASARIGWSGMFAAMGALVLVALGAGLTIREPRREAREPREADEDAQARRSVGAVLRATLEAMRAPGAGWVLAFIATYKLGESMADAMFTPFLIDAGYKPAQLGEWVGTYGMAASIAGSLAGGEVARRLPLLAAVGVTATLRAAALCVPLYLALRGSPVPREIIAATIIEHFFGGALTTAMFAFMMSRVHRAIGATHFTLLASVEGLGKSPGLLSGYVAAAIGYAGVFALAVALSLAFLLLLLPLGSAHARGGPPGAAADREN